ncbi:hypothetical protein KSP40_PGU018198 [Platanthera guangdongensis]|uniref:Vacuolar ATPase assembly protein VMA22 n=1 Tax=Platanthera guangdongensis TaxID=2320717 RepID=A0ABR2MYV3_9ASPA
MQDGDSSNPMQGVAEDEPNGECGDREEQALLFLDSLDGYLALLDSLSSSLRQGWLELACARQSMGSSRVSSTLLDLKAQSAATTVLLSELVEGSSADPRPHFTLSKWACLKERKSSSDELIDGKLLEDRNSSQLRHRGSKHIEGARENSSASSESTAADLNVRDLSPTENSSATSESTAAAENFCIFQKRRYKALSVFGAFVSPKLRAAQFSFETALETIVEIANTRSSLLSSFSQVQKDSKPSD